jgi:4'-phosphopantetheinyl transferase EntD
VTSDRHARRTAALRALLPEAAAASVWDGDDVPPLMEGETSAIARAVESRRIEFARGRACARRALAKLGFPAMAIAVGRQRQPLWPTGVVGAITHCEGFVAAAVARIDAVGALGIDAELARPLPPESRQLILLRDEMCLSRPELEVIAFSAKESVHKALFPHTGVWLDFLDLAVELDLAGGRFALRAASAAAASALSPNLTGRFSCDDDLVQTVVYLTTGS